MTRSRGRPSIAAWLAPSSLRSRACSRSWAPRQALAPRANLHRSPCTRTAWRDRSLQRWSSSSRRASRSRTSIRTDADVGPFLDLELARFAVLDQEGARLGQFISRSGARHRFRPFHATSGHRYCTRVLPRAWADDSVRFAAARDGARVTRVTFALDGDSRGCRGSEPCGALAPRLTGFAYGAAAARFTYGSLGFWRTAELDGAELGGPSPASAPPRSYLSSTSPWARPPRCGCRCRRALRCR